jgi:FkbM family methyltransferase
VDWLWRRAFTKTNFCESDYGWWRDRWGSELLLNPHYHLDFWIIAFGCYDLTLHRYVERNVRPGMTCLDVGANIGDVTLHLANKVGTSGAVHAFEPVPAVRKRLETNLSRNVCADIVSVHPFALSNTGGHARLSISAVDADNQGMASLIEQLNERLTDSMVVETKTLDDFVATSGIDRIDLLKVDIQGAEILFLEGGQNTLMRFKPDLLLEVSPADMAGIGKTSHDLLLMLESYGYCVHELRRNGTPGPRIAAATVPIDFARENILCTMK